MSGAQSVKTGISYGSLYLDNGLKTVDGVNYNLTVNGYLQMTGDATFDLFDGVNPFTLNVYGNYYNYGTIDIDQSTINLLGDQDVIFYGGGTGAGKPVYDLTVNKSGGMATLGSNVLINNNLNLTNGEFGMASTNRQIYINGNWTRSAGTIFNYGTANVYFQGTSQTISGTGSDDFYNVVISGGTKTLGDAVDVNNNLTIQATGGLDVSASDYDLFIGATFNNNLGGSFDGQNGTVTFDGSTNANLYIGPADSLWNMTLNKSAGSYLNYDEHDLSVGNNLLVQNGLLQQGTNSSTGQNTDLLVYGNWANYGTFRATQNDTVFFLGAAQTIIASGTDDFNNIVFGGTDTKTINSNVDANRTITINTGATLNVSGTNLLTVGRDFINNGTFTANTSTLKFDEYAGWNPILLQTNGNSLYNLIVHVRDLNEDLDLVDNLTVLNDLTVERGDLDVTTNNYSVTVGGVWTIESEGRFLANAGTVTLDGASAGPSETITTNSQAFNNLTLSAANTTYRQQDQLSVNGNLTITSGTLNLNSNDLLMGNGAGDVLSVTDSLVVNTEARLRMANAAALTVNSGGYIDVVGIVGYPAVVTNQGTGSYSFDVLSGGNIAAQYYTFEFMDTDGINVQNGAVINTTNDFSDGTFTNGSSGGTHLTIDNNQTFANISNVAFPTDPGGGASNVRKTQNQGSLTFVDASGAFQGDGNDDDNFGLISWTYGTSAAQWNGSVSTDWNNANNWTPVGVPGAANRVDIPSAPANQPVIITTTATCFHLTIQSGASLTLGGSGNAGELTVTGDVNLNGSLIFAVNDGDTLYVEGNWANTGTLTHNSRGAVVLTGPNDQNIASGGTGSGKTFYDLMVRKSGGKAILAQALKTDNDLSLLNGVFDVSSGNYGVEVGGNWLRRDVATFEYQAGAVTMSGASTSVTGTGTDDFYSLVINGSGVTLGSALNIGRDLTINASSSLDATTTNYSLTIYRNWTNNGTFTARSSNVVMNGVNQTVSGTATTTFYNITFANGGTKTINANFNVDGSLWLNAGTLDPECQCDCRYWRF